MGMTTRTRIFALSALLLCAGLVFAGVDQESYSPLQSAPVSRTGLSSADSVFIGAPITTGTTDRPIAGNPTVAVQVDFSDASETAVVGVVYFRSASSSSYEQIGYQKATATASALHDGDSYEGETLLFDSIAADRYEVRLVTAPSSGTVDIKYWAYGADSQ